jgi:hypothetical protein
MNDLLACYPFHTSRNFITPFDKIRCFEGIVESHIRGPTTTIFIIHNIKSTKTSIKLTLRLEDSRLNFLLQTHPSNLTSFVEYMIQDFLERNIPQPHMLSLLKLFKYLKSF